MQPPSVACHRSEDNEQQKTSKQERVCTLPCLLPSDIHRLTEPIAVLHEVDRTQNDMRQTKTRDAPSNRRVDGLFGAQCDACGRDNSSEYSRDQPFTHVHVHVTAPFGCSEFSSSIHPTTSPIRQKADRTSMRSPVGFFIYRLAHSVDFKRLLQRRLRLHTLG